MKIAVLFFFVATAVALRYPLHGSVKNPEISVTDHYSLHGRVDAVANILSSDNTHRGVDNAVANPIAFDGTLQERVNQAATVPVTSLEQLWRYRVGDGKDGITLGKQFICLLGQNMKFVRNDAKEWVLSDGSNCKAENRYQLYPLGGGVFGIKNVYHQQWWSCRDNGELWGVGDLSSWEKFKLFVDANGDNLTVRSSGWMSWYVYLWKDGYLYCGNKPGEYTGRNAFVGWKVGNKEWTASDFYSTIIDVDNRKGASPISKEITIKKGYTLDSEVARAGSMSTSLEASASFEALFTASITTSIGFEWSSVDTQSFSASVTDKTTIDVQPGTRFRVLEATGRFGPFTIHSGSLKYLTDSGKGEKIVFEGYPTNKYPIT